MNRKDFDGMIIMPAASQLQKNMSSSDLHKHPMPPKEAKQF